MDRKPLDVKELKDLLELGYTAEQIGIKLGYAKRTINEFIQKNGIRPAISPLTFPPARLTPAPSERRAGEAEYYLRKRIEDLEGILAGQRDEIGELKEDNRELTRERNKLARDLELAEERKQLDLQKLTLEHTYKHKSSLSGFMDAVSTNEKLGEVMVMVAQKVLGASSNNSSSSQPEQSIFSSAVAGIINQCEEEKQAKLATVVEALASPENENTLNELFALASGQNQQQHGHQDQNQH